MCSIDVSIPQKKILGKGNYTLYIHYINYKLVVVSCSCFNQNLTVAVMPFLDDSC